MGGGTSICSTTRCGSRAQLESHMGLRLKSKGSLMYLGCRIRAEQLGRSRRNDMNGLGTTQNGTS